MHSVTLFGQEEHGIAKHVLFTNPDQGLADYLKDKLQSSDVAFDSLILEQDMERADPIFEQVAVELIRDADGIQKRAFRDTADDFGAHIQVWGNCLNLSELYKHILEDICSSLKIPVDQEHLYEYVLLNLLAKSVRIMYSQKISRTRARSKETLIIEVRLAIREMLLTSTISVLPFLTAANTSDKPQRLSYHTPA